MNDDTGDTGLSPLTGQFPVSREAARDDGRNWETLRRERGWPTPNHMRTAAEAIDQLCYPKYGDVLRFVADLCDSTVPSRNDIEEVDSGREPTE